MNSFESSLIIISSLIVISVVTSKASQRFGIPALLLFLLVGVGASIQGFGGIALANYAVAQEVGTFALVFILFAGGFDTDVRSIRTVLGPALILSTAGVLIVMGLVGAFAHRFANFTWIEALLLGATIASTDVAAVFSVLRAKNARLKDGLAPLLELEAALNDPMAVFLGLLLLQLALGHSVSFSRFVPIFFEQMILGALIGWGAGRGFATLISRLKLEHDSLYSVLTVGASLFVYSITQRVGGSGFLAVYIAGVVLGNAKLPQHESLSQFHDGLAWLGQIAMFLSMGLLAKLNQLADIAPLGILLSLLLVFIARPLSVYLCLPFGRFNFRQKSMIAWGGLRGAVPIILATYVLASHISHSTTIFNLVLFITFLSVLVQGTTIPFVARILGVSEAG